MVTDKKCVIFKRFPREEGNSFQPCTTLDASKQGTIRNEVSKIAIEFALTSTNIPQASVY
jgi:hypothetical protein